MSKQGFSWTEIYFRHYVQAASILFRHLEIFRTFFQTLILPPQTETAIYPSHYETRGSFATISHGKCGLIDWLAFYLMRRLELVDQWKGYYFCCYLRSLHNSLVMESGCSGNDGEGKMFWGLKNLSSCCFLVAIKCFSHFIGECKCKYAVPFEMKEGRS